jgi:hypothetical protein
MTDVWHCGACHSLNQASAGHCYKCRAPRATAEFHDATGAEDAPGLRAAAPRDPSLIGAILLGLAVAIGVTAAWVWFDAHAVRGFFAASWLVGAVIATGVLLGGRGRPSFPLVLFSVLLTAVALAVGEYLIISQVLAEESGQVVSGIPVAQPQDVADVLPEIIAATPLRPVRWVIALVTAWLVPWTAMVGPAPGRRGEER